MSTAPGRGAVAIVRVSGPDARAVLAALSPDLDPLPPARRATLTGIVDPAEGRLLDRALVTLYSGPASYTGEDMVEIASHGGWLVPRLILDACLRAGAREAEAGEFTRRAYLNGKLDLIQAEAVADLVEGRSRALHGAALHQLDRGLSARIAAIRESLVGLEALLAHHLDFPEEDEAPVSVERVAAEGRRVEEALARLLETAPEGELLREGALAVLAGRPNSGKSSLFNALLGEERVIVTEEPGTTRDAVEAGVSLGGFPFRLVDTAGLRSDVGAVERLGIEVARRYVSRADVVLMCVEAGRDLGEEEAGFVKGLGAPVVMIRTKADLAEVGRDGSTATDPAGEADGGADGAGLSVSVDPLRVSVVSGEGLGELRKLLPSLVYRGLIRYGDDVPVLTRARQAEAVAAARNEVARFAEAVETGVPAEIAATHLRPAETALEELLGVITREDVLDRLFETFCIGK